MTPRPAVERLGRCAVLCCLLLTASPLLVAQTPGRDSTPTPLATLAVWAEDVWLALTDRDGSYFGRLADEGTFQRFNPLMDDEYELDLWTGLFTSSEDAWWAAASEGLRVSGASINHPFILNFAEWREAIPIAGPVDFVARYVRQRSLTAQRDYPSVGVRWRDVLGSPLTFRGSLGMHFFKSSADVEFALARRWGAEGDPRWTVDLRVALLDAFNNLIFNALGVEPEETPAHFDYTAVPLATSLTIGWASGSRRLELHGGLSTRSGVVVSFPASGEPPYALSEQVCFAGALAEAAVSHRVSVAGYGTVARAATDRRFTPAGPDDLRLREVTRALGLRGSLSAGQSLALELDLRGLWRPENRRSGDGSRVRHRDREAFGQVALVRRPLAGWTWRLGYAFMDREAGMLAPELTAVNHRQVMEGGYRFRSGFAIAGGVRWDLDRGLAAPFDGGHLRFAATW